MKSLEHATVYKGMIFAGCSFTWGQGLYYYSNMPTLQEPPPDQYYENLVTPAHIEFLKTRRWPRIVANHFNTFELVHPKNGGSNEGAIGWWRTCFDHSAHHIDSDPVPFLSYNEISHCVFQFTQFMRDRFVMYYNDERHELSWHTAVSDPFYKEIFHKWLEQSKLTIDEFLHNYKQEGFVRVKKFLQELESNGIKTYVVIWMDEWVPFVKQDPWMAKRLIPMTYNGRTHDTIVSMMSHSFMYDAAYNKELTIKFDYENFIDPPKDHHPSLKCHQVIAENVIKFLEEHERT